MAAAFGGLAIGRRGAEMAIRIDNSTVSDRAWGDVDKAALARRLQEAESEAAIREAFAYVSDLENRSEWGGPHHQLQGDTLVLSRNGVHALAAGGTATALPPSRPRSAALRRTWWTIPADPGRPSRTRERGACPARALRACGSLRGLPQTCAASGVCCPFHSARAVPGWYPAATLAS